MALLDDLNPQQREAVLATDGPVLVLAGAGTGKTRVITFRIAHLVAQGTPAGALLAVTFTNKAADEMKQRVAALLSRTGQDASNLWISTFHSFCARLLRREAPRVGLRREFAIYDEDDQATAVKLALARLGRDERSRPLRNPLERISFAKNHSLSPEGLAMQMGGDLGAVAGEVYAVYEEVLREAGALDFDDLLLRAVQVLRESVEAREAWSARFRYLLVDEYQDTNRPQYDLLRLLAGTRENLCVVGDEDQSIYSWRGADVGNILRFADDFPGARVIRLEKNYRSTQRILDAAGAVVAKNVRRLGKTLEATLGEGGRLRYFEAADASAEAGFVGDEILGLQRRDPRARIAIAYRTNAQSRAFEEALRGRSVTCRVVGGFSFYQRAEIKDALAYVRLALHPEDDAALLRVLNTPPRGIGKTTGEALRERARTNGSSLWAAVPHVMESSKKERATGPLRRFRELIEGLREERERVPPAEFLRLVLERTGYLDMLEQQRTPDDTARAENLLELVNAVAEGEARGETWEDFLDRAALVSDADSYDERAPVTLLTLHSAKGLEFDHVFLAGLEEGLFPHSRALGREEDIEEERRLCYVGMTRAKQTLTLTRAVFRRIYGNSLEESAEPSRFLREIPGELLETLAGSLADAGETRRYEPDSEFAAESFRSARGGFGRRGAARLRGGTNSLIGTRVRHSKYGLGTIIGVEGEGNDRKLTVSFSDYGTRKLLERYANLERA